ncbi:MAG: hypothetical protein ACJAVI_000520 [Candidatus Azotimanducaceae bacterium]|jgi:hypothetical protein
MEISVGVPNRILVGFFATVLLCTFAPAYATGLKLLRYGPLGAEKPGVLDNAGRIRDLSGHVKDLDPEHLGMIPKLAALDIESLPLVKGEPRIGLPVTGTSKIIAIGFNYKAHASEMTTDLP